MQEQRVMWEINITPLTDVFLVLLVVFMVVAPFLANPGIEVNLPQATTNPQHQGIFVTITKDMSVWVEDKLAKDQQEFINLLKEQLSKSQEKFVIIRGDKEVNLDILVRVLDLSQSCGAQRLAIATTPIEDEVVQKGEDLF